MQFYCHLAVLAFFSFLYYEFEASLFFREGEFHPNMKILAKMMNVEIASKTETKTEIAFHAVFNFLFYLPFCYIHHPSLWVCFCPSILF